MGTCPNCKNTILFGGVKHDGRRYCGEKCLEQARTIASLPGVDDEAVEAAARALRSGECPKCSGRGPVEAHVSYRVVSYFAVTSWRNTPHILCRSCARKKQATDLLVSLLFGWWGIPWGFVMTPVQLVRGMIAVASGDFEEDAEPSALLRESVRYRLAQRAAADRLLEKYEESPASDEVEVADAA